MHKILNSRRVMCPTALWRCCQSKQFWCFSEESSVGRSPFLTISGSISQQQNSMTFSQAESCVTMWRFSNISATNYIPNFRVCWRSTPWRCGHSSWKVKNSFTSWHSSAQENFITWQGSHITLCPWISSINWQSLYEFTKLIRVYRGGGLTNWKLTYHNISAERN